MVELKVFDGQVSLRRVNKVRWAPVGCSNVMFPPQRIFQCIDLRALCAPNDACDVLYGFKCYALQRCHRRTLEDVKG